MARIRASEDIGDLADAILYLQTGQPMKRKAWSKKPKAPMFIKMRNQKRFQDEKGEEYRLNAADVFADDWYLVKELKD